MSAWRGVFLGWSLAVVAALGLDSHADAAGATLLTELQARQIGMQVQWTGSLPLRVSDGRPAMTRYHVQQSRNEKLVDLVVDGHPVMTLSEQQLGKNGKPLGPEGVKRYMEFEQKKLERRGKKGEIVSVEVPIARLYAIGADGTLAAMDAETGRTLWSLRVGMPGIQPLGLDANDDFVTVVSGAKLYLYSTSEGKAISDEWIEGAPIYGPMIGGEYTFIWTPNGGVEGYWTEDINVEPFRERTAGGLLSAPVKTPTGSRFAWPTDRNYLYMMEATGNPKVPFRLQPPDRIMIPVAPAPGDFMVCASESGTVYCVHTGGAGRIEWRTILGQAIYSSPIVVNQLALVVGAEGDLFAMDVRTGDLAWSQPIRGMKQVFGGDGDQHLYATTTTNDLVMIQSKTGEITSKLRLGAETTLMPQIISDRMFIVGNAGQIQCLAPQGRDRPTPIYALANIAAGAAPVQPAAPAADPLAPANESPFNGEPAMEPAAPGADPFGAPAADPANPFGAAADPFGATQ